jgi:hypothetical protein
MRQPQLLQIDTFPETWTRNQYVAVSLWTKYFPLLIPSYFFSSSDT